MTMVSRFTLVLAALLSSATAASHSESLALKTCNSILATISHASQVYWPGTQEYVTANSHWGSSSSQNSTCVVEPGTTDDLAIIIRITGSNRTPFAVKSGGHATNPGFSSTTGVQISLARFSEVVYDNMTSTVHIGSGLVWDDVYAALEPHGVSVAGGRVPGIGVGGFATGGGYSWKSNQHGLTIDTVTAYDLVLPNGTFAAVTNASHPDLFFGLKGGYNNFGIITGLTLETFPQSQVWGGLVIYATDQAEAVSAATQKFSENNKDPKASLITTYNFAQGSLIIELLAFYDGPVAANGVFDEFLAIKSVSRDVSTRSYLSLVNSFASEIPPTTRVAFHTVSLLNYSQNLMDIIVNETSFWGNNLPSTSLIIVSYDVEPFHGLSTHATPAAYPHDTPLLPLNLFYGWTDPAHDDMFTRAMQNSVQRIYTAALAEGQDISIERGKQIRYPNYALWDTPLAQMYGENVHRLKHMRAQYDPYNVMSLAGGFRF